MADFIISLNVTLRQSGGLIDNYSTPVPFGFDVDDIISPIRSINGYRYFTASEAGNNSAVSRTEWRVTNTLSAIQDFSNKLFIGTVYSRKGVLLGGEEMVFNISRLSGILRPVTVDGDDKLLFLTSEDGDPSPVEYVIEETVQDIIDSVTPVAPPPGNFIAKDGDDNVETFTFIDNHGIDSDEIGDTLLIGATNASTINIGRSGATINIIGSTTYEDVTNLQVTDKLITINKGGGATTGFGSGIEVEENNAITAYFKTNAARTGWDLKSNTVAFFTTFLQNNLTANRINNVPDRAGTIAVIDDVIDTIGLFGLPKERYVYLVQEAGDATRMGAGYGVSVVTDSQSAYDAAVSLQTSLGGGRVVIRVGNYVKNPSTDPIVLSADMPDDIIFVGENPRGKDTNNNYQSTVGAIKNNGFNVLIRASNVSFGALSTNTSAGDGGSVTIESESCSFMNINTNSVNGNSGAVNINSNNCLFQNIDTSAGAATFNSGNVIFSGRDSYANQIDTSSQYGTPGTVTVDGPDIVIFNGIITNGTGNNNTAGDVTINGDQMAGYGEIVNVGTIDAHGHGTGNGATVSVIGASISVINVNGGATGAAGSVYVSRSVVNNINHQHHGGTSGPVLIYNNSQVGVVAQTNDSADDSGTFTVYESIIGSVIRTKTSSGDFGEIQVRNVTMVDFTNANLNITGLTAITFSNLQANNLIFGKLRLTSTNATENIETINLNIVNHPVKIYPESGLIVTFKNGVGNFYSASGGDVVVNGSNGEWIEVTRDIINGSLQQTNVFVPSKQLGHYVETITGDTVITSFNIAHNLGSSNILIDIYNNVNLNVTDGIDITLTDDNNIDLTFSVAPTGAETFRVCILSLPS